MGKEREETREEERGRKIKWEQGMDYGRERVRDIERERGGMRGRKKKGRQKGPSFLRSKL